MSGSSEIDVAAAVPGRPAVGPDVAPLRFWDLLPRLEKTAIGRRGPGGAVSVRRRERAGGLLFGPYWRLPGGAYRLRFRCEAGAVLHPGLPVLGVEIIALNRNQQAWRDFTAEELAEADCGVDFTVPPILSLEAGEEARFEFRFFHLANADLTIDSATLRHLEEDQAKPPVVPRWRLAGRFDAVGLARRDRNGRFRMRRGSPPGLALRGPFPYLRLAEGKYRLSLDVRATAARHPGEPAIGVAVVASSRWRRRWWQVGTTTGQPERTMLMWRDFTAAELDSDVAACEFEVPLDLALESGEDAPVEFQIYHHGGAAIEIAAIDLQPFGDAGELGVAPPRWRLLGALRRRAIGIRDGRGSVAVRAEFRPGIVLGGGRLPLQFMAGDYRMALRLRVGVPRCPKAPVLSAQITRRRDGEMLMRRSLAVDDIVDGNAEIAFTVPAAGFENSRCEIVLRHFGNADLAIDAVTVEAVASADLSMPRGPTTALRNIVIIGNCQAETIRQGFQRAAALSSRFRTKYHFVGLQKNLHAAARQDLEQADLLLVQDIRDWDEYPLREFIPAGTEIIKFPLLHFASLWPFDHYNGPGDAEAYAREWPNLTFLYHDGLLARLRREIPDRQERYQAYRSLAIPGLVNVIRLHDFERRRLVAMDRQFGFSIGKFILDHFRTRQLFYTTNHPNRQLATLLLEWLMQRLGVVGELPRIDALDHLKRLQVPIHPKIAADLDVRWADANTRYLYEGAAVTWEEYIRRYIDHYG